MASERFKLPVTVSLLLIRDGKILLIRRKDTGWQDGMYGVPAGHLDGEEPAKDALCREADEEVGIILKPENLTFSSVWHLQGNKEYIYFYFTAKDWQGEPYNREPHKCDKLLWAPLNRLPENVVPSIKRAIEAHLKGASYVQDGW